MKSSLYILVAAAISPVATVGSNVAAGMQVAGQTYAQAMSDYLRWADWISELYLWTPFIAVGGVCAVLAKIARKRSATIIFSAATLVLLYFYFAGYQASERAMLEEKWTAASLSVGLLPLVVGFPVLLSVIFAAAVAIPLGRRNRTSEERAGLRL